MFPLAQWRPAVRQTGRPQGARGCVTIAREPRLASVLYLLGSSGVDAHGAARASPQRAARQNAIEADRAVRLPRALHRAPDAPPAAARLTRPAQGSQPVQNLPAVQESRSHTRKTSVHHGRRLPSTQAGSVQHRRRQRPSLTSPSEPCCVLSRRDALLPCFLPFRERRRSASGEARKHSW